MEKVARVRTEAVRERLLRRNLTQNGLAIQHLKISTGYMSQMMNGTKFPSAAVRARMQEALAAKSFDEIFEIVERPSAVGGAAR